MRTTTIAVLAAIGLVVPTTVLASGGDVCTAAQIQSAEGALKKAEEAERAGRTKDAYAVVDGGIPAIDCAKNGYARREGLIERTSKKLGAEAEKGGRFGEAHEYFIAPARGRTDYPLADADRAMLKHAKASPDDYKVVSRAVGYFERREGKPNLKEVQALARNGGDRMLAKEEKTFAARKDSLDDLQKAREWFRLTGEEKRASARAEQRGDALLAEGTARSIETAMQYYHFAGNKGKEKQAQDRARRLGEEAARKGDHGLAARFYALSGDQSRAAAVEKQKEQAEAKRQQQFKQDQKALEKELGL
jgi:hypothetical protein